MAKPNVTGHVTWAVVMADAHGVTSRPVVEGAARVDLAAFGPKGGSTWEPMVDRMTRGDQLELF